MGHSKIWDLFDANEIYKMKLASKERRERKEQRPQEPERPKGEKNGSV